MNLARPPAGTLPLRFVVSRTSTAVRLEIGGEVDLRNSHDLETALTAVDVGGAEAVHLDLHELTFCDTAGARILLLFLRSLRASGHEVTIQGASPLLRKLLTLLGYGDPDSFA